MTIRFWCILSMLFPHQSWVNEWPLEIGGEYVSRIRIKECFDPVYNHIYRFDYYYFYCIIILWQLGTNAFRLCSFLTSVVLMNGLLRLGARMFQQSGVTSVLIPSTITSYGLIVVFKWRVTNKHSLLINNNKNNHIYEISKNIIFSFTITIKFLLKLKCP